MSNATELLRRALAELIDQDETICAEFCGMQPWRSPPIIKAIYDYLDAEPEAEPVANYYAAKYVGDKYERAVTEWLRHPKQDCYLYTRPEPKRKPLTEDEEDEAFNSASKYAAWLETENRMLREARKPLTDEEVDAAYDDCIDLEGYYLFEAGVRFAEKHHGISPRCENS